MADGSQIEWTDATWNPVTGCTKVSPGCAHCYIARTPAFRIKGRRFVKGATDLQLHPDRVGQPLHWRIPRRVFVNSLSDLFHPDVPDTFVDDVFAVMALTPRHTFQVLTKRPDRMRRYLSSPHRRGRVIGVAWEMLGHPPLHKYKHDNIVGRPWPLPNVQIGVSAENQRWFEDRVGELVFTPAAVRFVSLEPLLGPIDLILDRLDIAADHQATDGGLDWVIVGGESGPKARPCQLDWIRSIVQQCAAAGVPCFVKQIGAHVTHRLVYGAPTFEADQPVHVERALIRHQKGGDPAEWPADLRVRQFPGGAR